MFEAYKNRMAYRGRNMSEMLRLQSNMVIEQTWDRDPNFRRVYVVKVSSGLPEVTAEHELIDVKFNIKTYADIKSDEPSYLLQFRHGAEKRHPEIAIGSYVYMEDEDGEWKWWMIQYLDERPSFRQYQILECNYTFKWITEGKIYSCLGVQRVQQSYNSGLKRLTLNQLYAGTPLEPCQPSYCGNIIMAISNGIGMVKSTRIGQSNAAKLLYEKNAQRLPC